MVVSLEWGKPKTEQAVPPPPPHEARLFSGLNESTSVSVGLTSQAECLLSLSEAVEGLEESSVAEAQLKDGEAEQSC